MGLLFHPLFFRWLMTSPFSNSPMWVFFCYLLYVNSFSFSFNMINNWRCLKLNLTTCRVCIGNGMTCSDILAVIPRVIFQNCRKYNKPRSGEWYLLDNFEIRAGIIAKYHVQVVLLFVYDRSREIVGNAQETFISLRLKKHTLAFAFVVIFLRQWKKKKETVFRENQFKPLKANTWISSKRFFFFFSNHRFCEFR